MVNLMMVRRASLRLLSYFVYSSYRIGELVT